MVDESEHLPTSHDSAKLEGYKPATLLMSATDKNTGCGGSVEVRSHTLRTCTPHPPTVVLIHFFALLRRSLLFEILIF